MATALATFLGYADFQSFEAALLRRLRCVEGHDLETVARMTRCSLATVKRRISRTQKFLEHHFIHPEGDEPSGSRSSAPDFS